MWFGLIGIPIAIIALLVFIVVYPYAFGWTIVTIVLIFAIAAFIEFIRNSD